MKRLPSLFLSHGAPTLALESSSTADFLRTLGGMLPRPEAIVLLSAHWEAPVPTVSVHAQPPTIHDFQGFPEPLYRLRYPTSGATALAYQVVDLLTVAGFAPAADATRGLDHGAWVPLRLIYAEADIPVVQVSLASAGADDGATRRHLRIGEALRPLRDQGVLILGSGSVTHNLRALAFDDPAAPVLPWVAEFNDWLALQLDTGNREALVNYRRQAPHAARNHPTEEHLLPLLVAAGAAYEGEPVRRLHAAYCYGGLGMDAWQFGA